MLDIRNHKNIVTSAMKCKKLGCLLFKIKYTFIHFYDSYKINFRMQLKTKNKQKSKAIIK